jgi:hypothetical protein
MAASTPPSPGDRPAGLHAPPRQVYKGKTPHNRVGRVVIGFLRDFFMRGCRLFFLQHKHRQKHIDVMNHTGQTIMLFLLSFWFWSLDDKVHGAK